MDTAYSHMLFNMALSTAELVTLAGEVHRAIRPDGLHVYTVRHTGNAHYGIGTDHGDGTTFDTVNRPARLRPEGFRQLASSKGSEDPRADRRAQHYGLMAQPQRSELVADTTRERRSLLPALRWVAVVGAVVGAVLYSNWLLEIVFTGMLPDPDLFISELAAADQPYGEWFRGCDLAVAVVLVVAAAAALVGVRGGRWSRRGWWTLGVFAVATGLDSTVWTLVCAPSSDATCAAREASGAVPIGHQLHLLSSAIAVVAAIVSLFAFVVADLRERAPAPVRRVGLFMLAALVGTSVWTGVAVAIDSADGAGEVGIAQRAELAAVAGWLIYVALRTARARMETSS